MKALTKRQLVRKPSLVSSLKPGQSLAIQDGDSELVITRKGGEKLSPEEIEAQLQRIFKGAPRVDCRDLLDDLRRC